jgi:hypothetical protein
MFISFALIILYLPMSTMAVHALVWSEDFWQRRDDDPTLLEGHSYC